MNIWLIKDSEPLPLGNSKARMFRMGMLAEYLSKRMHHVTWWTSNFCHFTKTFIKITSDEVDAYPNCRIKLIQAKGYKKNISIQRIFHNRAVAKKFRVLAHNESNKPDLILVALPTIDLSYEAIRYGKENNIPVIVDLRDMWPDILTDHAPWFLRKLARFTLISQYNMMKFVCANATALCSMTNEFLEWGLDYANRRRTAEDAVHRFAYTAPTDTQDESHEHQDVFKKILTIKNEKSLLIAYIGTLGSTHLDKFIAAIQQSQDDIHLIIVGTGKNEVLLKQQANTCNRIHFTGFINKSQIAFLMKIVDIGLLPYLHRKDFLASIPNKVAEYLSAGLPILSTIDGSVGQLLRENKCGIVCSDVSKESLQQVLSYLFSNKSLFEQMSINSTHLFYEQFEANKVLEKFANYLEAFSNTRPRNTTKHNNGATNIFT